MKFKTQIIETREGNLLIVSSNLTEGAYFSKNLDYLRGVDDPQEEWNWATTAWDNAGEQYQKIFDESIFPKWKYFRRWKISYGYTSKKILVRSATLEEGPVHLSMHEAISLKGDPNYFGADRAPWGRW